MSLRGWLLVWLAALSMTFATAAALPKKQAAAIFLGSSLIANAIPPPGTGPEPLLPGVASHDVVWHPYGGEALLLSDAASLIRDRPKVLFLEADSFVFDFDNKLASGTDKGEAAGLLHSRAERFLAFLKHLRFQFDDWADPRHPDVDKSFAPDPDVVQRQYPLHPRDPLFPRWLAATVASARAAGVEVVLIAPPRSEYALEQLGPSLQADIDKRTRLLADQIGVPLFAPPSTWPNELFWDHAHLNRQGRKRFLGELRTWWAARDDT